MTSGNNLNKSFKMILDNLTAANASITDTPQIESESTQLEMRKFEMYGRLELSSTVYTFSYLVKGLFTRQVECNQSLAKFKETITTTSKNRSYEAISTKTYWNQKLEEIIDCVMAPYDEVVRMTDESDAEGREKIRELNQRLEELEREQREKSELLKVLRAIEVEQRELIGKDRKVEMLRALPKGKH